MEQLALPIETPVERVGIYRHGSVFRISIQPELGGQCGKQALGRQNIGQQPGVYAGVPIVLFLIPGSLGGIVRLFLALFRLDEVAFSNKSLPFVFLGLLCFFICFC